MVAQSKTLTLISNLQSSNFLPLFPNASQMKMVDLLFYFG